MSQHGGFQPWDHLSMRASDADRERTVDVLKSGFSEGRLTREEYDQRVGLAFQARTYAELDALVRDLPQGPFGYRPPALAPMPMARPPAYQPGPAFLPGQARPTNGLAVASLVCGLAGLVTGLPSVAAIALGHRARGQIRRDGQNGEGAATAGAVLGYLGLLLWAFLMVGTFTFTSGT